MNLEILGWQSFFSDHYRNLEQQGLSPARVIREQASMYIIYGETGESAAELSGRFKYNSSDRNAFPSVGDWVAAAVRPDEGRAVIHALVPRRNCFSRKVPGDHTDEQVLAANVDVAFIVNGLDGDYNPRRIERYLTLARDCRVAPVILLNKADLCSDPDRLIADLQTVTGDLPIHLISALENDGLEPLGQYLTTGRTAVLLGSSGVGKSTIINRLLGFERLRVRDVRASDSRGRHTTTWRELIILPHGGMIIDTPGLREIQLWADQDSLDATFTDIEQLAADCRFRDCTHRREPDCAVRQAAEEGRLDPERLKSYLKLRKELRHLEIRQDQRARLDDKARWKKLSKAIRRHNKSDPKRRFR